MRTKLRLLGTLVVLMLLAIPAYAYRVILKTGQVIEFQRYRTTENLLLILGKRGKEIAIPLSSIDLDQTQKLNANESPALDLPGMQVQKTQTDAKLQLSLGEAARKLTKANSSSSKRVYTDDDVAHSGLAASTPASNLSSNPDTWRDRLDAMRTTVTSMDSTAASELAHKVLGNLDVDFPGRREWAEELFSRKETLVSALQTASLKYEEFYSLRDVLKRSGSLSKGDEDRLVQAQTAADSAINYAHGQQSRFEGTVDKGKQRALEWKRK